MIPAAAFAALVALTSCSMMPKKTSHVKHTPDMYATAAESSSSVLPAGSNLPEHYSKIEFPEYKYVAPYPKDFRVQIADGITGYIVSDRSLPLVDFTVYFEESNLPQVLKDEAAFEMVGSMIRRGSGGGITPHVLEDSLEFVSASISTSVGTFLSAFDINCLSAYFPSMLELSKKVLTDPSFDKNQLEIVKANYVTAYERRFETPAKVLSALKSKVNYAPNPRLWDANAAEYKAVTAADVKRLAKGVFSSKRIVFALAGDVDKDSAVVALKKFFADWKVEPAKTEKPKPTPLTFARKPGVYVVDKDITQANITMNQPFVKRPHPDYYPTAVASFILGGGSFSSRLMNRVRSDEGLAYSVYSTVGNDYRDTAMTTIALQTKVETVDFAMKLIFEEVEKLAKETPDVKVTIFAKGELLGKTDNHYIDYVTEINAVTAEQVKAMIAKYFDKEKMTISIVGPVAMFDSLKPFTVVPLDSLEFR